MSQRQEVQDPVKQFFAGCPRKMNVCLLWCAAGFVNCMLFFFPDSEALLSL